MHVKYSAMDDQSKAEFAVRAWLETESIEQELNLHTCDVEKATSRFSSFCSSDNYLVTDRLVF